MALAARTRSVTSVVRWGGLIAMLGGGAWIVKVAYIVLALDPNESDAVTTILYIAGFLLPVAAAVGVAAWLGAERGAAARVGIFIAVVLVHVFTVTTLSEGVEAVVDPLLTDSRHLVPEVPVALIGLIWFVLGRTMWTRSAPR
jgi:hypothetical protein